MKKKALALISGGLDSLLSALVVQRQGIEVTGVFFLIPFYLSFRKRQDNPVQSCLGLIQEQGIAVNTVTVNDEFLQVLLQPKHGYGSHMNPCIDCRILMLRKAKEMLADYDASFIVTGEIIGQRPMSQHKHTLAAIDKEAGVEGLVLRPLCAKLLQETIPEKNGWILREGLFSMNGRSRRPQRALAKELRISGYPNAAGGCLLTDKSFSKRVKDVKIRGRLTLEDVELLKLGRHFRLSDKAKLVVGRYEEENEHLFARAETGDYLIMPPDQCAGATALARGEFDDALLAKACSIAARYCDWRQNSPVAMWCQKVPLERAKVSIVALDDTAISRYRI